ncbi:MAG: carboxypeptidase-like regulatory domain-containing protein [Planctomycetota bacterium]
MSLRLCNAKFEIARCTTDAIGAFSFGDERSGRYAVDVQGTADGAPATGLSPFARTLAPTSFDHVHGEWTEVEVELADPDQGTRIRGRALDQFGDGVAGIEFRAGALVQGVALARAFTDGLAESASVRAPMFERGPPFAADAADPCADGDTIVDVRVATDASGAFVFEGLPPGLYRVELVGYGSAKLEGREKELRYTGPHWILVVDTTREADVDIGTVLVFRSIPLVITVHVFERDGSELSSRRKLPIYVSCVTLDSGYTRPAKAGGITLETRFVRSPYVGNAYADGTEPAECYVELWEEGSEPFAKRPFDAEALTPGADGVRRLEMTFTLP